MQQTPAERAALTLPPLKHGCFWHAVHLGHGTEQAECRWEAIEGAEGDVIGRYIVIEAVFFGGALVQSQHWPEELIEQWCGDVQDEIEDDESESHLARQIDAYQSRVAA